ncbi:protein SCAF8 [Cricetulus griseus]|nr:protein SCAF8 [Cricetulus griseus]
MLSTLKELEYHLEICTVPKNQVWASRNKKVVAGATDFNTDPGCGRATDPDMTFGNRPGLDITMAPSGK